MRNLHKDRVRVGSWPGPDYHHNEFIQLFCQSLTQAELEVVHVSDPRHVSAEEIDVLHIHWPEKVFWDNGSLPRVIYRFAATLIAIRRLKRSGVVLVWTVHNLEPHDLELRFRLLWSIYLSQMCQLIDGFVTLSPTTLEVVQREIRGLRNKPGIYAWHPPYPCRATSVNRLEYRREVGIIPDDYVFAFVGLVRPYKGIEELIDAFRKINGDKYSLIIAGATVREDYATRIRQLATGDPRIHIFLRNLSGEEFARFTVAADLVVLPFRDSLHSGSLVHTLSQQSVALTPATPFSTSLAKAVSGEWVQTYLPPLTSEILLSAKPPEGTPSLEVLSTSVSGPKLAEFYRRLGRNRNGDE